MPAEPVVDPVAKTELSARSGVHSGVGVLGRWRDRVASTGGAPDEPRELKLRRATLTLTTGLIAVAGVVWGVTYAALGRPGVALVPLAYSGLSALSVAAFVRWRRFELFRFVQLSLILVLPFAVALKLGGFAASSAVMLWALLAPLGALMFGAPRDGAPWFVAFALLCLASGGVDARLAPTATPLPLPWPAIFYVMNLAVPGGIAYVMLRHYVRGDRQLRRVIADQQSQLLTAKKLGSYTLEEKIGEGGMGTVYRARHALLRRPTAIKVVDAERSTQALLTRFEREVQATAALAHPNVIDIYDYGHSADGDFYYAMEYLPGIDLETLVEQYGPLPIARALHALVQATDGLHEAHSRGLIHRDVKPANLMLNRMGTRADVLKVLDFGLVKDVARDVGMTAENAIAGTPSYLAPEAIDDQSAVGPPSDVYALGAVAYFLLCGQRVFTARSATRLLVEHLHATPVPPSVHRVDCPAELEAIVLRCLAKAPADRFATAGELRSALATVAVRHPWDPAEAHRFWDSHETRPKPAVATAASRSAVTVAVAHRGSE